MESMPNAQIVPASPSKKRGRPRKSIEPHKNTNKDVPPPKKKGKLSNKVVTSGPSKSAGSVVLDQTYSRPRPVPIRNGGNQVVDFDSIMPYSGLITRRRAAVEERQPGTL
jgi:hypothetical protein